MNCKVHFAGTAIMTFLACSGACAQTRGGGSSGVSMPAREVRARTTIMARESGVSVARTTFAPQVSRQPRVIQIAPNGGAISSASSFANSFNFDDEIGVPGLGFDFVHLAAVSGNFRSNPPGFGRGDRHQRNNFI